ncbi:MAG: 50S ribosomal protein L31 [Egibacteraceae bacterium]
MKQGIHPEYVLTRVRCSCGNEFTTRGTSPEIRVELCNQCHPFYTGKQKLVDSGGRVERYKQRYAKSQEKQAQVAEVQAKRQQKARKR